MEIRIGLCAILALYITTINADDDVYDCEWTEWGPCSTTCGNGTMVRYHEQEALNGGEKCTGPNVTHCYLKECKRKLLNISICQYPKFQLLQFHIWSKNFYHNF